MSEWEPATEVEAAMRDALRAGDQELYFRILARSELLLPVSADALAGRAPMGWGTWTTGGRTHVLAFTSGESLRICLADNAGSARRMPYHELAGSWPNLEWWLAINPGLPIEGYLPAWFVSQLSRGDVRLPGRTMGARARLERAESVARARATAVVPGQIVQPSSTSPSSRAERLGRMSRAADQAAARRPTTIEGTATVNPPDDLPANGPRAVLPAVSDEAPARGTSPVSPAGPGPINRRGYGVPPGPQPSEAPDAAGAWPASPPSDAAQEFRAGAGSAPRGYAPAGPRDGGQTDRMGAVPTVPPTPPATGRFAAVPPPTTDDALTPPVIAPVSPSRPPATPAPPYSVSAPPHPSPAPPHGASAPGYEAPAPPHSASAPPRSVSSPPHSVSAPPYEAPAPPAAAPMPPHIAHASVPPPSGPRPPAGTHPPAGPRPPTGPYPPAAPPQGYDAHPSPSTNGVAERPSREPFAAAPVPDEPARASEFGAAAPEPAPAADVLGIGAVEDARLAESGIVPVDESGIASVAHDPESELAAPAGPTSWPDSGPLPAEPTAQPAPTEPATDHVEHIEEPAPGPATAPTAADAPPPAVDFRPANDVEESLLNAAGDGSTDAFLSTLLLARVLLPASTDSRPGTKPGADGFVWRTETLDDETYVVVFTSKERMHEHLGDEERPDALTVKFVQLINRWPDETWSFAVNPGTPVGAKLPGAQIVALASWAAEVGLGADDPEEPVAGSTGELVTPRPVDTAQEKARPTMMQKAIAASQVDYYLDRGYDRVSGFVHRSTEVAHLRTPAELYAALGLGYPNSPFAADAAEVYVLRWPAYRPSLYRIPYGGQNETAMRAMEGWVIERPPFRGNGFAPGDTSDVIAEFKVDSARLPHGAQLWRIKADGDEELVAILDSDAPMWRKVGETGA